MQRTLTVIEDCAGSVIWYRWITHAYHSKHYTYTGRFWNSKGGQAGQGHTGEA